MGGEIVGRCEVGGGVEAIPRTPLSHKYGEGTARLSQSSYEQNVILLLWQSEEASSEEGSRTQINRWTPITINALWLRWAWSRWADTCCCLGGFPVNAEAQEGKMKPSHILVFSSSQMGLNDWCHGVLTVVSSFFSSLKQMPPWHHTDVYRSYWMFDKERTVLPVFFFFFLCIDLMAPRRKGNVAVGNMNLSQLFRNMLQGSNSKWVNIFSLWCIHLTIVFIFYLHFTHCSNFIGVGVVFAELLSL